MIKIKEFLKKCLGDVKNNILLVGLVVTSVLNDVILRALTVGNVFSIKPVLTSVALLLIVSVVATLLSNKRRDYLYVVFSGMFGLLNAANYMYYTHFNSFISVGIFNQSKHISEMKGSVMQTLNFKVLLFLIPTLLLIIVYKKLKDNDYFSSQDEISMKRSLISPFITGVAVLLMIAPTLTGTDISRLTKQWNREYLVEQFGIYSFTTADIIKATSVPRAVKADYGDFDEQLTTLVNKNKAEKADNKYTNILEGKDLYVIHYESVQNFAMDLSFESGEVTPFLNKLSNESMYFNNFYPQHSVGTSADSEFTFSTSLYPINNGTVFMDHADKEFESIQSLLADKGYHTMSMHGNNGSFWNRNIMHPNIGYQEFLSKQDYVIDEEIGLGLSDRSFYSQSVQMIKQRKTELDQPLMATLISLTNHYPFDALDVYGEFNTGHLEGTGISNYLKSMNYADQALEAFFAEMDQEGLLDNAAVLIYGDHHAKISKADYELIYNYDEETDTYLDKQDENYISVNNAYLKQVRKTPLILWTKDKILTQTIEEPIGMINVMPTLANMLNIDNQYRLGQDIFSVQDNTVIFPEGSFLTKDYYYAASNSKVYDMYTNELILEEKNFDEELIKKIESVEKRLGLSSTLIENDLTKYYKDYLEGK